jgi:hypothetical protein
VLTRDEKALLRTRFKLLIYEREGQAFEDLFTSIMSYAELDFIQIKPWGVIGDRKNDGYIPSKGIFFQVFAPEDVRKSYPEVIKKLKDDFSGLLKQWPQPIKEFYFVLNEKYKGINADSIQTMNKIKLENNLLKAEFITASKLENLLFSLPDDQILTIAGAIPNIVKSKRLDFSVLNEVIDYIINLPFPNPAKSEIKLPDWDKKIKFNQLSEAVSALLNTGSIQITQLENYIANRGNFLGDTLRDKMNEIYISERDTYSGDVLFWKIIERASPKTTQAYLGAVLVIMSKYFESCDIFDRPMEEENDSSN